MLELAGEIFDGVVLNYVVSVDYIRHAISLVEMGAKKTGKTIAQIDRPELLACSLSDTDPAVAMIEANELVAHYLATEPHIMKASGVNDDLLNNQARSVGANQVVWDGRDTVGDELTNFHVYSLAIDPQTIVI